jgi:hypothetical protein
MPLLEEKISLPEILLQILASKLLASSLAKYPLNTSVKLLFLLLLACNQIRRGKIPYKKT